MLTQEQRIKNLGLFIKKLNENGINTDKLIELYGNKLQNAPLSDNATFGMAYEGCLIYSNLYKLTPFAFHINEKLPESLKVDKDTIVKACLLSNLAKAEMFKPCNDKWMNEKRGIYWEYEDYPFAFRTGQRTLLMLQECGIYDSLTKDIIECILSFDAFSDDNFVITNASPLTTIVRLANQLMWFESNRLTKLKNRQ